jgi:hypothetical protein
MKDKWMWALGTALVFIVLFVPSSLLRSLFTYNGYGMMDYGWHMPMMYGGGMLFLAWLILLGLLILIVLGIAWLVKTLTAPK